jgi:hypothetical protein
MRDNIFLLTKIIFYHLNPCYLVILSKSDCCNCHVGVEGNERADKLAKLGTTLYIIIQ